MFSADVQKVSRFVAGPVRPSPSLSPLPLRAANGGTAAGDAPASAEEFLGFLQTYHQMGGSLDPDKAPPEIAPVLRALVDGAGGPEGLAAMLSGAGGGLGDEMGGTPGMGGPTGRAPPPVPGDREEIFPEPGFVVKTIDDAGRKVFVNVCGHAKLQAPGADWANGKVPEHVEKALSNLEDPNSVQQLRFPVSVSEGRNELDKAGQPCTVYDAVFNDEVVKQAIAYRKLKVFLVELCLQWVGQKYSLNLDPKYKLPHRKYMGDTDKPVPQMIRVDKKSMIEEINEPDEEPSFPLRPRPVEPKMPKVAKAGVAATTGAGLKSASKAGAAGTGGKVKELSGAMSSKAKISVVEEKRAGDGVGGASQANIGGSSGFSFEKLPEVRHQVEYVNRPVTDVSVHVPLPEGVGVEQVRMCVVMEGVTVDMPNHQPLRVQLPFVVDGDKASASYEEGTRTVTLRAPYMPYSEVLEAHKKAGAHAVGDVKLSSSFLDI